MLQGQFNGIMISRRAWQSDSELGDGDDKEKALSEQKISRVFELVFGGTWDASGERSHKRKAFSATEPAKRFDNPRQLGGLAVCGLELQPPRYQFLGERNSVAYQSTLHHRLSPPNMGPEDSIPKDGLVALLNTTAQGTRADPASCSAGCAETAYHLLSIYAARLTCSCNWTGATADKTPARDGYKFSGRLAILLARLVGLCVESPLSSCSLPEHVLELNFFVALRMQCPPPSIET